METIEGIVLKVNDYSETSKLVKLFTPNEGVVTLIVKGAKRPKRNLLSILVPVSLGSFNVELKGEISTFYSCETINLFSNIKMDFKKYTAVLAMMELIYYVLEQRKSNEKLYNFLKSLLEAIEEGFDERLGLLIMLFKCLYFVGLHPELNHCSKCGVVLDFNGEFHIDYLGAVCEQCCEDYLITCDLNIVKAIYLNKTVEKLKNIELSDDAIKAFIERLSNVYSEQAGINLKSISVLQKMLEK